MRRFLSAAAIVIIASCARGPTAGKVVVGTRTMPARPVLNQRFDVEVTVRDDRQQPVAGANVELVGQMNHPGMAPVVGSALEGAPGIYRGSLTLTMAGAWTLQATATLPDGRRGQQRTDIEIAP